MKEITIVIVNWNSGKLLKKCLTHLVAQTHKAEKIIIVDNASNDNSIAEISAFDIELVRLKKNIGFAAANNMALELISSEYVALLNPDAFPEPSWLEQLFNAAEAHKDISAFGSRQLDGGSPNIIDGIGDRYHISGMPKRYRYGMLQKDCDLVENEIFSACAAAVLYRTKDLRKIGGFDTHFFCYVEDVDLGFRLRLSGYKAMYVPEAVVYHIGSASTGGHHSDFAVYHGHRNLVWVFVKNMPGVLFWFLLPLHIVLNFISIVYFFLKGQLNVIVKAKWHAILNLPVALKQRKQIQKNRTASISDIWQILDKRLTF